MAKDKDLGYNKQRDELPPCTGPDGELNIVGYEGDDPEVAEFARKEMAKQKKRDRDRLGL